LLRTVQAIRYVTPLREGGSLPAVVEGDDDGTYVLKFRGAGQGPKALIAELVAGEIGRALGLRVPELVFVDLDPTLGRSEPDFEIQALLKASAGLNLALDFLPGSFDYNPIATPAPAARLASEIVWFDAFVTNVDRTVRNTNLLVWHRNLWLIDHGAALYFHHNWGDYLTASRGPFPAIKDHVLLRYASALAEVDAALPGRLTPELIREIVAAIPDDWLAGESRFASLDEHRAAYCSYLLSRLAASATFVAEAERARTLLV